VKLRAIQRELSHPRCLQEGVKSFYSCSGRETPLAASHPFLSNSSAESADAKESAPTSLRSVLFNFFYQDLAQVADATRVHTVRPVIQNPLNVFNRFGVAAGPIPQPRTQPA